MAGETSKEKARAGGRGPWEWTRIAAVLEELAPLRFAEEWDRVGLLAAPAPGGRVRRLFLAVDLTEEVLEEALAGKAGMILAYHPPLFHPLTTLSWENPKERILIRAIRAGIPVYSPHTALDAAPGGVNDWLASGLGPGKTTPLSPCLGPGEFKLVTFVPPGRADGLRAALARAGAGVIGDYRECSFNLEGTGTFFGGEGTSPVVGAKGRLERVREVRLEMVLPPSLLPRVARVLAEEHPYEEPAWDVYPLERKPLPGAGQGRMVELRRPLSPAALVRRVKKHLGLRRVRAAFPPGMERVERVALCAGAGNQVLQDARDAQVVWTGEMSHHAVLAHLAAGRGVILCGHTETERGYLPVLAERIAGKLPGLQVVVSRKDRPPLASV